MGSFCRKNVERNGERRKTRFLKRIEEKDPSDDIDKLNGSVVIKYNYVQKMLSKNLRTQTLYTDTIYAHQNYAQFNHSLWYC